VRACSAQVRSSVTRDAIELAVLGTVLVLYAVFGQIIQGKAYVIAPATVVCAAYLAWSLHSGRMTPAEFGLRIDNLPAASRATLCAYSPVALAMIAWFVEFGDAPPPVNFYVTLVLYPFWGIVQQFVFQSLLHVRLLRLGLAPWGILITAAVYAAVHCHSPRLAILAFPAGLISSWLFQRTPNIFPLGVAHGLLGAIVYYLVFQEDPLSRIFNW